jgi:hypothetical protein
VLLICVPHAYVVDRPLHLSFPLHLHAARQFTEEENRAANERLLADLEGLEKPRVSQVLRAVSRNKQTGWAEEGFAVQFRFEDLRRQGYQGENDRCGGRHGVSVVRGGWLLRSPVWWCSTLTTLTSSLQEWDAVAAGERCRAEAGQETQSGRSRPIPADVSYPTSPVDPHHHV